MQMQSLQLPAPRAQDHWRVNVAEAWEVRFWAREFRCSESELRHAVQAAGAMAGAVRAYLAGATPRHNYSEQPRPCHRTKPQPAAAYCA